ncbi:bifunctional hydroxymethylpyrimidine kinase/phosphomethylpyrimidine kinase [Candidatus Poriferisodalis sp.]|uniref:bifunctional hydroxymethylpyrimidine kinase/phosphomethylpyrimidine kinase n=1 Tax=Candidatus Poriferisodalis sp. TaxID=3101277 RepID=UPI003B024BDB
MTGRSDDSTGGPPPQRAWSTAALTIAGADSSGAAGLAADLRAFAACGVHGSFALTLVSAQNTTEFRAAQSVDAELVATQIETVLDDMPIAAAKTGLMLSAETISAVASVAARRLPQLVVDPVLVNGKGEPMLSIDAERAVATRLLGCARVVTPNHLEAGLLVGRSLGADPEAWIDAARELAAAGPETVVVTGGRAADGTTVTDVVVRTGGVRLLSAPRVDTRNVRGAGDVFSAAICAELAKGTDPDAAIDLAHDLTSRAIAAGASRRLGSGQGPVDPLRL